MAKWTGEMRKYRWLPAFLLLLLISYRLGDACQEGIVRLKTETGIIEGTLLVPDSEDKIPVALMIAGSGPTDRDGNQPAMMNDSLKMLTTDLLKSEVATLRYDKRGVGKSIDAGSNEANLRFEHYISDAEAWIDWLDRDTRFSSVFVIGHSEGSLVGSVAAQGKNVDGFISIAGPGRAMDKLLKDQLKFQPPEIWGRSLPIIDKLAQGETVRDIAPVFYPLFRPSVQPYLISCMRYNPCREIAKLTIPVLIVQGTTDIQVGEADARLLAESNSKAELKMIAGMNHILKEADSNRMKNIQTYNQTELPIKADVVEAIVGFVRKVSATGLKTLR